MRTILLLLGVASASAALLFLLDRFLLRMEERGWIYYRKRRGHADRVGDAAFRVQALFEPGKRYVLEEREKAKREERGDGAPPG
ncbi:MAG: hypothetical protein ACOYXN_11465 [Acidobacteriota bacterium]